MSTYTYTDTITFTLTHAKYLASKVATDLKRIQRLYTTGPSDEMIAKYEDELTQLLKHGYLDKITYGYRRNGKWIQPTIFYTAKELGSMDGTDDDPGKIVPGADVTGAAFGSFVEYTSTYENLSSDEKKRFKDNLPFQRSSQDTPAAEGYFSQDRSYFSGGTSLNRSSLKSY